jgi:AcrR family transcriptional regulator
MSRGSKQTSREDILNVTRKLFTESDYNNVSLRDISKELGISVGNLSYYYKSKIELIEAAILEKREQNGKDIPATTIRELDELLQRSQDMQEEQLCYYRQYSQLSDISVTLRDLQLIVYRELEQIWLQTFSNFRESGLMKAEQDQKQTENLISAILFLSTHWHERDALDKLLGIETPEFKETVWSLLLPLFTDKGAEIYREKN